MSLNSVSIISLSCYFMYFCVRSMIFLTLKIFVTVELHKFSYSFILWIKRNYYRTKRIIKFFNISDALESFSMYGKIPDARNAIFNVWRDYEDIRISDVSFYLRLNHSRLVTSKLKWRPEIKTEIMVSLFVCNLMI